MGKDSLDNLNIPLPSGQNLSVPYQEGTILDIIDILASILQNWPTARLAVEIECGDCCKKVLNVAGFGIVGTSITLFPAEGECLLLKVFSGGKLVETRTLIDLEILIDQIISIELAAVEVPIIDKVDC